MYVSGYQVFEYSNPPIKKKACKTYLWNKNPRMYQHEDPIQNELNIMKLAL